MYTAEQISTRRPWPATPLIEWQVALPDGREGKVYVALYAWAKVEATDKDAYVREAIADKLNASTVPEDTLAAGAWPPITEL